MLWILSVEPDYLVRSDFPWKKIRRNERMSAMDENLSDAPNRIFTSLLLRPVRRSQVHMSEEH